MKKLISILLCVAMVLSLAAVTFATEDDVEIVLGDNVVTIPQATTDAECWRYITFTPDESGTYVITNTNESGSYKYVYIAPYYWNNGGIDYGVSKEVELEAGVPYEFAVQSFAAYEGDVEVAFNISKKAESEEGEGEGDWGNVEINELPQVGDNYMLIEQNPWSTVTVAFEAEEDGVYTITCKDDNACIKYDNTWYYEGNSFNVTLLEYESVEFVLYGYSASSRDQVVYFTIEQGEYVEEEEIPTNDELQIGENLVTWTSSNWYQTMTMEITQHGVYTITNNMEDYSTIKVNGGYSFYSGESKKIELDVGDTLELQLYSSKRTHFALTIEYQEGSIERDGSSEYPYILTDEMELNFALSADDSYTGLYYTFTAPEDGELIITVTEQTNLNKINSMNKIADNVYSKKLRAGESVKANIYGMRGEEFTFAGVVSWNPGELQPDGSDDFPYIIPEEGQWDAIIDADHAYDGYYYSFTAPSAGTLFVVTDSNLDGVRGWYFYEYEEDGNVHYYELDAGEEFSFCLWSYDPIDVRAAVVFIPEGEEIVLPEAPELPSQEPEEPVAEELVLGLNEITVEDPFNAGRQMIFTAPADGTYVFTITNELAWVVVVGNGALETNLDEIVVDMVAGEAVTINFFDAAEIGLNIAVQEDEPGEDPEEPDGSYSNPLDLPVGEWVVEIAGENAYDGLYYAFTATEAGTLTIDLPANPQISLYELVWGIDYELTEEGDIVIEMEAGDSFMLNPFNYNSADISFTAQVTFVGNNTEVEPEPDGDMTFVFFAMVVLSMAGMVVLVSKKRSF